MIRYSPEAEPARAFLLRGYNDIDVFVEDVECQNMYVALLGRMLSGKARIFSVSPLGSRANVLAACRADQAPRPRKRLYLIDADQDLILGRGPSQLAHFYRLRTYCAENLLLCENALITVGTEYDTSTSWPDMAIRLELRPLFERAIRELMPLFITYGVVAKLGLTIRTVDYPVQRLLVDPNDPTTLSSSAIRTRTLSIIRAVRQQVSARKYRTARDSLVRRIERLKRDHSAYISAKTYLLPLAHLQLRRKAGLRCSQDQLKVRLAALADLYIDAGLRKRVRKAAG